MKKSIPAIYAILFLCILSNSVNAQSWSKVYTNSSEIYSFAETSAKNMFVRRGSTGLLKSSNSGATWAPITPVSGYPTTNYNIFAAYQNNLFLINFSNSNIPYVGRGFFVSTDQGLNWTKKNNGLGNDTILTDIRVMSNGTIFVTSTNKTVSTEVIKMYRSTNNGNNWSYIMTMTHDLGSLVETSNGNYFTTIGNDVFKSTNSGTSWTMLAKSDPINYAIAGSIVVASNDSLYMDSSNFGLVRSIDGINWTAVPRTGWPASQYANTLIIAPNDTIYAGINTGSSTNYGVYMSADLGKTWTKEITGLPSEPQIFPGSFWLSNNTGYLFASPFLSNIYRTTTPVFDPNAGPPTGILSPADYSDKYSLTVSPNPAVQQTEIGYTLASTDVITIELLDQSGKVVKHVLTNSTQSAGKHTMELDVTGVKAGLYLLSVRSSDGGSVKKIVVN